MSGFSAAVAKPDPRPSAALNVKIAKPAGVPRFKTPDFRAFVIAMLANISGTSLLILLNTVSIEENDSSQAAAAECSLIYLRCFRLRRPHEQCESEGSLRRRGVGTVVDIGIDVACGISGGS